MRILLDTKKIIHYDLSYLFPDDLLNEDWAINIHGQSLAKLNARGGMSPSEIIGNIKKLKSKEISSYSEKDAVFEIKKILLNSELHNSKLLRKSVEWWDNLPIQNLEDMSDSWVGYVNKYYPGKKDIYRLTPNEILNMWMLENKIKLRKIKIEKIIKK